MRAGARRFVVRLVAAAVILPLLAAGLLYYYFLAAMVGLLSVPVLYSGRLSVSNGGILVVEGVSETSFRSKGSDWRARYVAPGGESEEEVGSWFGTRGEFTRAVAGGSVVFVAAPERVFVRTGKGAWRSVNVSFPEQWDRSGIHAGALGKLKAELGLPEERLMPGASASYFSPDKRELVIDLAPWTDSIAGRLYFQLSPDGERFELVRVQKPGRT